MSDLERALQIAVQAHAGQKDAVELKISDLEDNSDIRRLLAIDDRSVERLRKYLTAYKRLTAKRDERFN